MQQVFVLGDWQKRLLLKSGLTLVVLDLQVGHGLQTTKETTHNNKMQCYKHGDEPAGFLSSSWTKFRDLINSAISPNLLGDSGFQSTYK